MFTSHVRRLVRRTAAPVVVMALALSAGGCARDPAALAFDERPCPELPAEVAPDNIGLDWLPMDDVRWHVAGRRDDFEVAEGTTSMALIEVWERFDRAIGERDDALVLFSEVEEFDAEVVAQGPADVIMLNIRTTCRDRTDVRISVRQ